MAKKEKTKREKGKLWKEFKEFINRGNAFMLAIGVVIGSAFTTITNSVVAILTSLCTWAVPGGLKGLVTVLPAVTSSQQGIDGIGQTFAKGDIADATIAYAAANGGGTIDSTSSSFATWQTALLSQYTLYGDVYYYNNSAIINWGDLINAIISFLIVAIVLFIIVKVYNTMIAQKNKLEAEALEKYYVAHPEERPVPPEPGKPAPTETELLTSILAELKKQNGSAATTPAPSEPTKE